MIVHQQKVLYLSSFLKLCGQSELSFMPGVLGPTQPCQGGLGGSHRGVRCELACAAPLQLECGPPYPGVVPVLGRLGAWSSVRHGRANSYFPRVIFVRNPSCVQGNQGGKCSCEVSHESFLPISSPGI